MEAQPSAEKAMTSDDSPWIARAGAGRLEVRRVLKPRPERVFAAWTSPDQLRQWWGPAAVTCVSAEVDWLSDACWPAVDVAALLR